MEAAFFGRWWVRNTGARFVSWRIQKTGWGYPACFSAQSGNGKKAVCIQNAVSNIVIQGSSRKVKCVNAYKSPFLIVLFI